MSRDSLPAMSLQYRSMVSLEASPIRFRAQKYQLSTSSCTAMESSWISCWKWVKKDTRMLFLWLKQDQRLIECLFIVIFYYLPNQLILYRISSDQIVIFLIMLRLKRFVRFGFSNMEKFRGAEAIFATIFSHDKDIKQVYELEQPNPSAIRQNILKNNQKTRTVLSDQIVENIRNMIQRKELSNSIGGQLIDIFDPTKGTDLDLTEEAKDKRFTQGRSKAGMFPLCPNSALTKYIASQIFHFLPNQKKLTVKHTDVDIAYMVGTPGFGKSFTFLASKIFLDMRIKQIIEGGSPKDSIFQDNYKLFYFKSTMQFKAILEMVLKQVEKDFKSIPEDIKNIPQIQANFELILQKVKEKYSSQNSDKKIKILAIVDQANILFGHSQCQTFVKNWKVVLKVFNRPFFMVSSKNNPYMEIESPVIRITRDQTVRQIYKLNMDNALAPDTRLCSTIQCLLFQLQRKGLPKNEAIQFVKQMQDLPFLTHLAIRNAVDQFYASDNQKWSNLNQKILKINTDKVNLQKNLQEAKKKIATKGKSLITDNSLKKGIEKKQTNEQEQSKQNKQSKQSEQKSQQLKSFALIVNFISFSSKNMSYQDVFANLSVKNEKRKIDTIKKLSVLAGRYLGNGEGKLLKDLKDINFFFQIGQYLYITTPPSQIQRLREIASDCISPNKLKQIKELYPLGLQMIIKNGTGPIFQNQISTIFSKQKQSGVYLVVQLRSIFELIKPHCFKDKIMMFPNSKVKELYAQKKLEELTAQQAEQIKVFDNQLLNLKFQLQELTKKVIQVKQSGVYVRTQDTCQSFDFILCQFSQGKIKLVLVDTAIGRYKPALVQKINKFYTNLLPLQSLKAIIRQFNKEKEVKSIELYYYLLRPHKQFFPPGQILKFEHSFGRKAKKYEEKEFILKKEFNKLMKLQVKIGHFSSEAKFYQKIEGLGIIMNDIQNQRISIMQTLKQERENLKIMIENK